MRLILTIVVLLWYSPNSRSQPTARPDSEWRKSRFIIDNRRNGLFTSKAIPLVALYPQTTEEHSLKEKLPNETSKREQEPFPVDPFHKDLNAEASFLENNFYRKYNENAVPKKLLKSYKIRDESPGSTSTTGHHFEYRINDYGNRRKNSSSYGYEPQNFIHSEDNQNIVKYNDDLESTKSATSKVTLGGGQWGPKIDENILISVTSSTATTSRFKKPSTDFQQPDETNRQQPTRGFGFGTPSTTTTTTTWEFRKPEDGNLIDKNPTFLNNNEKHVYETRIETVSYHQEVIYNQPKVEETVKQQNWYQPEKRELEETTTYQERNKEDESINVTDRESYSEPKKSYQEPERNYEETERNYEEPERNYEEPERNYEEPEKNYEVDESINVMTEGRTHGPQAESKEEENQNKFGYVVEGRNYRKYRVEERTADGFIVGEYGVVSHDDGSLRGVRYTADSTANPQLIYETLIKFLSL